MDAAFELAENIVCRLIYESEDVGDISEIAILLV